MFNKKQIEWSKKIVAQSISEGVHLAELLRAKNKTYDDLCYESYELTEYEKQAYRSLDDFRFSASDIPTVSFFSGAGGLDLGFEAAGFGHQALYEKIPLFCETLRHNRPDWKVLDNDVSVKDEMIFSLKNSIGSSKFSDGLFVGGPPCQPFSIASNQRFSKSGENFKRVGFSHETNGNLLFDYIDLIIYFKPRAFLIENVPGLKEIDDGGQLMKAYGLLAAAGYSVNDPLLVSADKYQVPQNRKRLFIIGGRSKKTFVPPAQTAKSLSCASVFDMDVADCENHITREHTADSVLRYMALPYGTRDQLGRVDRLDPSRASKTIIAGGTKGGGRSHLHPYFPRTLSVRESARLQTFPDDYIFTGPVARQFTQVGNAVPPVLAAQLAASIRACYF
jgi:DNA (cytosine-5)-methyltransferase 1